MKMRQLSGGGYWLEVADHRFEVELDDSKVPGVYGGMINHRQYYAKIDGERMGGPYDSAAEAKARLAPFVNRVKAEAEIAARRESIALALSDLYPAGLPQEVKDALDAWDGKSDAEKVEDAPEGQPESEPVDLDGVQDADAADVVASLRKTEPEAEKPKAAPRKSRAKAAATG